MAVALTEGGSAPGRAPSEGASRLQAVSSSKATTSRQWAGRRHIKPRRWVRSSVRGCLSDLEDYDEGRLDRS